MRLASFVSTLLLVPVLASAQQPRPAQCTTPEHRAFDFWVGEWEVSDSTGKVVAASSIQLQAAGCAVMEHWMPKGQPDGVSISWLEPLDKKWHQRWVGGGGWITSFIGGMVGKEMVLGDEQATANGGKGRMIYTALADGRVRQTVESSTDGGKTWTGGSLFYKKKG